MTGGILRVPKKGHYRATHFADVDRQFQFFYEVSYCHMEVASLRVYGIGILFPDLANKLLFILHCVDRKGRFGEYSG